MFEFGRAMRSKRFFVFALVFAELALTPRFAAALECHGVTLPPSAQVGGKTLILNGMGIREATMFKVDVYVAGLYLAAPAHDGASVLRQMNTMRIVLTLKRDVGRDQMTEAVRNGLRRNAGNAMPVLQDRATRLEQLIPDLRAGDTVTFTYYPVGPGWLVLHLNGREHGRIAGTDFGRAVFAIWLNNAPTDELKRALLGGPCR
jgi:hypothetical protein